MILNEFLFDSAVFCLMQMANKEMLYLSCHRQPSFIRFLWTPLSLLKSNSVLVCLYPCFGNVVAIKCDFRQNIAAKWRKRKEKQSKVSIHSIKWLIQTTTTMKDERITKSNKNLLPNVDNMYEVWIFDVYMSTFEFTE